jgi:hypothetical protein
VPLPTSHRFGGASAGVPYAAVRRLLSIQTDGQPPREHIFAHSFMQLGQPRRWLVRSGMLACPGKTPAHKIPRSQDQGWRAAKDGYAR